MPISERERVIANLVRSLESVGIDPDGPFSATFIPGEGWTFSSDAPTQTGSSSSSREGARGEKR